MRFMCARMKTQRKRKLYRSSLHRSLSLSLSVHLSTYLSTYFYLFLSFTHRELATQFYNNNTRSVRVTIYD